MAIVGRTPLMTLNKQHKNTTKRESSILVLWEWEAGINFFVFNYNQIESKVIGKHTTYDCNDL